MGTGRATGIQLSLPLELSDAETERANGLAARCAELERERNEARQNERAADAQAQADDAARLRAEAERDEARAEFEADNARLREVLAQVRDAMRATGQEPDGDDDPRRPLASAVWAALASTPAHGPRHGTCALRSAACAMCCGCRISQKIRELWAKDPNLSMAQIHKLTLAPMPVIKQIRQKLGIGNERTMQCE